jgi:hypothetical protein
VSATTPSSENLKLSAVRRAFRLIGEIRQLGADPQQWRPHLLRKLMELADADLVVSSEVHFRAIADPAKLKVIDIGWGLERGGIEPWRIQTEREDVPESYMVVIGPMPAARPGEKATAAVESFIPVAPATPLRGGRSFLLSQYPLVHLGAVDQLGLHRNQIDHPFTAAEAKLVRLFHVELGRLWKEDALDRAADPAAELPPRLVQTLDGVLHGESEKQIAYALGLSQHTVHNYVRALHKRFGVSSRAELIAKAAEDRYDFRPKLSVTVPKRGARKRPAAGGVGKPSADSRPPAREAP